MYLKITKGFFIAVAILTTAFTLLFVFDTDMYDDLSQEDQLIEYLSSVFLFVSSYCFFRAFLDLKNQTTAMSKWLMILFLLLSVLFFLGAGEEISWGQRLFNISTPEYLNSINDQNELNLHNINKKYFDKMLDRVTILFVMVSCGLFLFKKDELIGIQTPNIYIICAFGITLFYKQGTDLTWYHFVYIPLVLLFVYSVVTKSKEILFPILVTFFVSFLVPIVHTKYYYLFPSHNNSANEYREFLFCLCCLAYSYLIMRKINSETSKFKS